MQLVRFTRFGGPEVLELVGAPLPIPGPGQVRVRLTAAAVNHADLALIAGSYPLRPRLPATPGLEGAGWVEAVGPGVTEAHLGERVVLPLGAAAGQGTWREAVVVPADLLLPTPPALTDEQAGGLWVSYLTAWALLTTDWEEAPGPVLATAAGSSVGLALGQLARLLGRELVGLVRRPELAPWLLTQGYQRVMVAETASAGLREERERYPLVLDAVGGPGVAALLRVLAPGGVLVLYGTLDPAAAGFAGPALLFGEKRLAGFWLNRWLGRVSAEERETAYATLLGWFASGDLQPLVERTFPLAEVRTACQALLRPGRRGKILLRPTPAGQEP
jgi:NADPH:quinone reductase-like Zn-dependent oxidoreductase